MAHPSDPSLAVLLALRLSSFAPAAAVAEATSLPVDEVDGLLQRFGDQGWARFRDGRRSGWSLTAEGRKEGERLLGDELDALGIRSVVQAGYQEFLVVNPVMLELCTDWQLRRDLGGDEPVLNDHADLGYDGAVLERFHDLHGRSRDIWIELGGVLERFGPYDRRFEHAAGRVAAGEHDWFTKPSIDSYHTVWFELHEHLLATLGIERANEQVAS